MLESERNSRLRPNPGRGPGGANPGREPCGAAGFGTLALCNCLLNVLLEPLGNSHFGPDPGPEPFGATLWHFEGVLGCWADPEPLGATEFGNLALCSCLLKLPSGTIWTTRFQPNPGPEPFGAPFWHFGLALGCSEFVLGCYEPVSTVWKCFGLFLACSNSSGTPGGDPQEVRGKCLGLGSVPLTLKGSTAFTACAKRPALPWRSAAPA